MIADFPLPMRFKRATGAECRVTNPLDHHAVADLMSLIKVHEDIFVLLNYTRGLINYNV